MNHILVSAYQSPHKTGILPMNILLVSYKLLDICEMSDNKLNGEAAQIALMLADHLPAYTFRKLAAFLTQIINAESDCEENARVVAELRAIADNKNTEGTAYRE